MGERLNLAEWFGLVGTFSEQGFYFTQAKNGPEPLEMDGASF